MKIILKSFSLLLFLFLPSLINAQIASITALSSQFPINSPIYSKIEFGVNLDASINTMVANGQLNPYDPDEVNLYAELLDANTMQLEKTVYGFYMKEYLTNADGQATILRASQNHNWRLRLVVEEPKQYVLKVYLSINNGSAYTFPQLQITGQASASHGYLKFPKKQKYLEFSDHTSFFGVATTLQPYDDDMRDIYGPITGQHTQGNYPNNTVRTLREVIEDFSGSGGNFLKYYFMPTSIEFEWDNLGNFNTYQNRAQDFDKIIETIETNDVYLQLGLWSWEQFSTFVNHPGPNFTFNNSPYKNISGVTDPTDVFVDEPNCTTNTIALNYLKRKIRYCIARWGYSPNVAALEILVEPEGIKSSTKEYWSSGACGIYASIIDDAFISLGEYIKSVSPRILVTTGAANHFGPMKKFFNNPVCDYVDFHLYNTHYINGGSSIAYASEHTKKEYNKPFHIGESGSGSNIQWFNSSSGDLDGKTDFSNLLWSSSFSGSFTTAMHWSSYGYLFSRNLTPTIDFHEKFLPLSIFFQGEDLNKGRYKSIKNRTQSYPIDCNSFITPPECEPLNYKNGFLQKYPNATDADLSMCQKNIDGYNITDDEINSPSGVAPIITSADDFIEVYALQSDSKVLGWVHNKTNYFYTLPHRTNPSGPYINFFIHPDINNNKWTTQAMTHVADLNDRSMTISGLNCSGTYKIDWYSTRGNGGIIPNLTVSNLQPTNGSIFVTIPDMRALSNSHSFLPDYGFKITMTQNNGYSIASEWKTDYVNADAPKASSLTPITVTNNNRIYYVNNNGALHCSYYDEHCWEESEVPVWTYDDLPSTGTGMAATDNNKIFYRNNIGKLEQIYEGTPTGNKPNWVAYMHGSAPSVSTNCDDIIAKHGSVFYVSASNYITEVYWNGSSWSHIEIGWPTTVSAYSGLLSCFTVMPGDKKIFYRNTNGKLEQLYWAMYQGVYQWISYTHTTAHDVKQFSDIKHTSDGRVIYTSTNGYITVLSYNAGTQQWSSQELSWLPKIDPNGGFIGSVNGSTILYKNITGNMQEIYWALYQGVYQWIGFTHGVSNILSSSPIISNSLDQRFYYDQNGDINELYYDAGSSSWIQYTHSNASASTSAMLTIDQYGKIYYKANLLDRRVKVLWWDNPCVVNPPCTYANYKPTKPVLTTEYAIADSDIQSISNPFITNERNKDMLKQIEPFEVYPNPSNEGIFNISCRENADVEIKDISGKSIYKKSVVAGINKIDLSNLSNGVYILQYITQESVSNKRLVIKK